MTTKIIKQKNDTQNKDNNTSNTIIFNNFKNSNTNRKNIKISSSSPGYKFCQNIKEIDNQNKNGFTPIYCAILSEDIPALNDLLSLGANPNIPNFLGETPLYLSVYKKNLDALIILLKYNADCNIPTKKGNTPLHLAVQKNMEKIIEMILRNKANPNIENKLYGQTATHLAIINRLDEDLLVLFKECKADIYFKKDKFNKSAFDYAKDSNEYYINLLINIFGNNNISFRNKKYIDNQYQTWNEKKNEKKFTKINCGKNNISDNFFNINNILNYTERNNFDKDLNKSNCNSNDCNNNNSNKCISNDTNLMDSETNKNEFKLEENNSRKESDKIIYTHGRAILSSDLCSNNIQIKELNNSSENSPNSKKSSSSDLPHCR